MFFKTFLINILTLFIHISKWEVATKQIFLLAAMGVLAPGSAHTRPSAGSPIDMSENFAADVSAKSPYKISSNHLEVISKVSEPWNNLRNPPHQFIAKLSPSSSPAQPFPSLFLDYSVQNLMFLILVFQIDWFILIIPKLYSTASWNTKNHQSK